MGIVIRNNMVSLYSETFLFYKLRNLNKLKSVGYEYKNIGFHSDLNTIKPLKYKKIKSLKQKKSLATSYFRDNYRRR